MYEYYSVIERKEFAWPNENFPKHSPKVQKAHTWWNALVAGEDTQAQGQGLSSQKHPSLFRTGWQRCIHPPSGRTGRKPFPPLFSPSPVPLTIWGVGREAFPDLPDGISSSSSECSQHLCLPSHVFIHSFTHSVNIYQVPVRCQTLVGAQDMSGNKTHTS